MPAVPSSLGSSEGLDSYPLPPRPISGSGDHLGHQVVQAVQVNQVHLCSLVAEADPGYARVVVAVGGRVRGRLAEEGFQKGLGEAPVGDQRDATAVVFDNPEWSTLIIGNGPPLSAGGQSRQMLNLRVWW